MFLSYDSLVFEKKTGVRIEEGKSYSVGIRVEGAGDFQRVLRRYSESQDVRLFVPKEFYDKVSPGKRYDVTMQSIHRFSSKGEVAHPSPSGDSTVPSWRRLNFEGSGKSNIRAETKPEPRGTGVGPETQGNEILEQHEIRDVSFDLAAKLIRSSRDRIYFEFNRNSFHEKIGVKLEAGQTYMVRGRIDGIGGYEKRLENAMKRQIHIYVPMEYEGKIRIGETYRVSIDSIERIERKRQIWMLNDSLDKGLEWNWKEVASWVDTEGHIGVKTERGGNYLVGVSQKEKQVLEELGRFLYKQDFSVSMKYVKGTGTYTLEIIGAEHAARLVRLIEPHIRTENKKEEIERFKESLMKPRKLLWPSIRRAREILGLG